MRFVLDQDTPVSIRTFLQELGHDCWSADQAALAEADDDELAQYAQDKAAILISHDAGLAAKRKQRTFGLHVWLHCHQLRALETFQRCYPAIEPLLEAGRPCVLECNIEGSFHY